MEPRKMHTQHSPLACEITIRILLWTAFLSMELFTPFQRVIQPEEMWLYKYPNLGYQYVTAGMLWMVSILIPLAFLTIDYLKTKNKNYYRQGILCLTLLLGLNGFVTTFLKIIVGRPRPDYYHRCWPEGTLDIALPCTGERKAILEGRKSFPSGHASFSFTSMVFVSLLLANRLKLFGRNRGDAWRLIVALLPLVLATAIAVSRTCDYHHHWQDVVCGGLIGAVIGYLCYYQYFPGTGAGAGVGPKVHVAVTTD